MNWVKVYNSLPSHPKILMAGTDAAWMYVCGLCYSNEHLTDGAIAKPLLPVVAPGMKRPEAVARKLVDVGLWEQTGSGWQIHDYTEVQRSAAQVKEIRRKDRTRKTPESTSDSVRNPDGIQTESNGIPDSLARSQEKRREEKTPLTPRDRGEAGEGQRVVRFRQRPVAADRLAFAEAILAEFNRQAGTGYGAYTAEGKPSEDLKRILGALADATPPLEGLDEAKRIIARRLAEPFWQGRPHTGVVFGPNVFAANRENAKGDGTRRSDIAALAAVNWEGS